MCGTELVKVKGRLPGTGDCCSDTSLSPHDSAKFNAFGCQMAKRTSRNIFSHFNDKTR